MKIAYFTETWLPNIDGVVTSILTARKELERRGHSVIVLAPGKTKRARKMRDSVFLFPAVKFPPYPTYKIAVFPYAESEQIVKEKDVDVIHSHGMGSMGIAAFYAARRLSKPLIGTLHTNIQEATHYITGPMIMQNVMKKVAWRYLRLYFNRCDAAIVPSEYMRRECEAHGIRNVTSIPNGVDMKRFRPGKRTLWKDRTVVLNVGRVAKEKNLDVLIKGAKQVEKAVPDVLFVIVGSGPAEEYYKGLVKQNKVEHLFRFVGGVPPKNVIRYYHNADVFAFPSVFETQGLAGVEAMSCGLPVAGADYLAIPDIVEDGKNGRLFDPHDPKACADAVIYCIRNRKRLGANAVKTMQQYSIEKTSLKLIGLYERMRHH